MSEEGSSIRNWIPLATKLVWPVFIVIGAMIFQGQIREAYSVVLKAVQSGRSVEIGIFRLGDTADQTEIQELSVENLSIEGLGGAEGAIRKGSAGALERLQEELRRTPERKIDTLLLPDGTTFSIELLKQYIGTLGLRYVVFQEGGRFAGWMRTSSFVAQLPEDTPSESYRALRNNLVGVSNGSVPPDASAKQVLMEMQQRHTDALPVVSHDGTWMFFASRGDILGRLMSDLILEERES